MICNHIAVLVNDIEETRSELPSFCDFHEIEQHEAEGTIEQYVGVVENGVWLLLVQAMKEGPYARALQKRGPGLHHIGCVSSSLDESITRCTSEGLLLHSISLRTYPNGVVWLCRPGIPFLIELMRYPDHENVLDCRVKLPLNTVVPSRMNRLADNLSFDQGMGNSLGIEMAGRSLTINV